MAFFAAVRGHGEERLVRAAQTRIQTSRQIKGRTRDLDIAIRDYAPAMCSRPGRCRGRENGYAPDDALLRRGAELGKQEELGKEIAFSIGLVGKVACTIHPNCDDATCYFFLAANRADLHRTLILFTVRHPRSRWTN
jgi:hypothetical protein